MHKLDLETIDASWSVIGKRFNLAIKNSVISKISNLDWTGRQHKPETGKHRAWETFSDIAHVSMHSWSSPQLWCITQRISKVKWCTNPIWNTIDASWSVIEKRFNHPIKNSLTAKISNLDRASRQQCSMNQRAVNTAHEKLCTRTYLDQAICIWKCQYMTEKPMSEFLKDCLYITTSNVEPAFARCREIYM